MRWQEAVRRSSLHHVRSRFQTGLELLACLPIPGLALLAGLLLTGVQSEAGSILREVWHDIPGTSLSALTNAPRFPNQPSETNLVAVSLEAPTDIAENYGQRLHGYIVPPVSGEYQFWIASDDAGELWLSTDENPANQRRIASVASWTSSREWTKEENQRSAGIRLEANRPYYIAALQKEGGGGDNLAVRWLRPDGADEAPIPASYLLPWGTAFTPPRIQAQPAPASAIEGQLATFQVQADPLSPATVQWQRNGVDLPGGNAALLTYGPVSLSDHNARFRAVLSNGLGSTLSAEAVLTVSPDVTAPAIESVLNLSPTQLRIIFTEPVDGQSATTPLNYQLDGGIVISSVSFLADESTVVLATTAMTYGVRYSLSVANVRDRAATPNTIAPGTVQPFTAIEYVPADIGISGGSTTVVPGGFDVTGAGEDIGGSADQCHFAHQERTGDFDMRVRLASLSVTHPYVQAGLMVRENLERGARFVGVFASSAQLGCFLESRSAVGSAAQISALPTGFPVNYPHQWLRLRRSGSQFTAFGSFDGMGWQQFGSVNLSLGSKLLFGMAVASHNTNAAATARFRDLSVASNPEPWNYRPVREPLGPSSRRTGLVFSEIMYHPASRADGKDLEFIEIYNAESIFVDLTGWRLAGAVEYEFPEGLRLPAGGFAVIAADPSGLAGVYGLSGVLGPYAGRLNNAGDTLKLLNAAGAVRLKVDYQAGGSWPVAADGPGHSLVLARPSYGEDDARAWEASDRIGGSPGEVDALTSNPWRGVVINEFLAHTDDPVLDYIELYNASGADVDLSGCFVSDDLSVSRFRIPDGTVLPPRGFVVFDQGQIGFALHSGGETIYLTAADQSRVLDAVRFGGQENGISAGRVPDGGPALHRLAARTPGAINSPRRMEEVVINEIYYHPISGQDSEQFVELHNPSAAAVDLRGWRFASGIEFQFPAGATIPPGGFVVVAKDAARLRASHPHLTAANTFGDFQGTLSRSGELLVLTKPDTIIAADAAGGLVTNVIHIAVSEVHYREGGRWPELADGGGSSLELVDPRSDLQRGSNWQASDETAKSEWASFEFTGIVDNNNTGQPNNRLQILMQGAGECLVDDVEVFRPEGANLLANGGFENGSTGWSFFGNHRLSSVRNSEAFAGQACLHVRSPGDGDTGNNAIRANLSSGFSRNQTATLRAKVRWLAGWPEVLLRIRGNGIELPIRMKVPQNLGTPGQPNSRRQANGGPAIFDVRHWPALPRVNEPVTVTCRVSDPDGVAVPQLRFRVDPASTLSAVDMRDDGGGDDALAGDGLYTATISGRSAGTLIAFRIQARDDAPSSASGVFPADAPDRECLVRWDDTIPFGSFAHYHLWSTAATETARRNSRALDNTYRDATLVYGNFRVVYNAGFRDKGSPYHGGAGDYAVTVPQDDLLLGAQDRVFGSTGNGGSENTGMAGDVSAWIGQRLGIPYLHSHYMRLYRNGSRFREILYDLEQPNRDYAEAWFGGGQAGDELYKIAVWFEFADDNSNFQATGATLQRFLSGGDYKLARYRWNWQIRPSTGTVNDLSSIFNLVTAANTTADRVTGLMHLADMEEWMRAFAFNRILGNWDAWTFNVGQNMYLYTPLGGRAVLMPWDIDFVLGQGNGPTDSLWGGQDPVGNALYDVPTYRRMLWRAYQDAIGGPMQREEYEPQINARRNILLKNNVSGLSDPRGIRTYLEARRNHLQNQLRAADAQSFSITSAGGTDFSTGNPVAVLTGTAPFAVAAIEVNGVPYPVSWTSFAAWRMQIPLGAPTNALELVGVDLRGRPVAGASSALTIRYTGPVLPPEEWVVINEIMYHPPVDDAEFLELHNPHPAAPFDLSGFRLNGIDFTFPSGTVIAPNGYLVMAQNRAAFASAYGTSIPVVGEYAGRLDNGGETLSLLRPEPDGADTLIDDVRYDRTPPWPSVADGQGPSLQLIDPRQDNWRPANWAVTPVGDVNQATPGRANATAATLEAFSSLWINEVLPGNVLGPVDNFGERDPWIELYNAGTSPLSLSGYYLSDDDGERTRWPFPAGAVLGPGQFLLVWADAQPGQSMDGSWHTNFRLNPTSGLVLLSRVQLGIPAVLDYIAYTAPGSDTSFGGVADGEPRRRRVLLAPTPGAPNNPNSPVLPVFINEWLASNRAILTDPADGNFDDWFELYNAGGTTVDLSGYFLTDDLANITQFRIPNGTVIPPGGYRLVWADGDTDQNTSGGDLHASFRLAAGGGQIALLGPDEALIDGVTFGPQTADTSEGRFPDGTASPFFLFTRPTPGTPNSIAGANQPPVIAPIADVILEQGSSLALRVAASDPDLPPQSLTFDLAAAPPGVFVSPLTGDLVWQPAADLLPGSYAITIRATDNGSPPRTTSRTFNVTLVQRNVPPVLAAIADVILDESALFTMRLMATDSNLPAQRLTYSLAPGAPEGGVIDPVTGDFAWTPTESQGPGSYTVGVRVTDDGDPPLTAERSFTAVVREVNNPPLVDPVSPQSVAEETLLQVQIRAIDPDDPPLPLTFALEAAPAGVSVDPASGLLSWTPREPDGPRDYQVSVRVSEPGGSPSTVISFLVGVSEVNAAPVLEPLGRFSLHAGDRLAVDAVATDPDLPAQTLTFSTGSELPAGATLDPVTGGFAWTLGPDLAGGTNRITIRVTDDGSPPLWSERTMELFVDVRPRIAINEIMHRPAAAQAEFVELVNHSAANVVDLSGWRLEGYNFLLPAGTTLEPGGYLCVARDLAAFRAAYGLQPRALGNAAVVLPPEGGRIRLLRPAGAGGEVEVFDEVLFALRVPWPAAARQNGASLQLIDPEEDNSRVGNWTAAAGTVTNAPVSVIPMTGSWRYWQSATHPGASWNAADFNDSAWASGPALLFVESASLPAAKNTPLTLGRTTYYFRSRFNFTGNPAGALLRLSSVIDDGAVFYLNGQEIHRLGMPQGAITSSTFASRTVGDAALEGPVQVAATGLRPGENVLAVEVHQVNSSSSDVVFGASAELISLGAASSTPGSRNSGAADLPAFPPVWINELLPLNTSGLRDNAGEQDPWIELYQAGPEYLLLAGWSLSDDYNALGRWLFPSGSAIPSLGLLLVWADGEAAESAPGFPHAGFRLSASGGVVALGRPQGSGWAIVDYVEYGASPPDRSWGALRDGEVGSWQALSVPSPGMRNALAAQPVVIESVRLQPGSQLAISCGTRSGLRYRLQVASDLARPAWETVREFTGDGSPRVFLESISEAAWQRFYRLVAE